MSKGGRGGQVFEVTNLNDSGIGSLRACVQATMPRICVFRVGGTIITESEIVADDPFLTIAGQTATGGGITLRASQAYHGETLVVSTHDVIIRYMRFRAGASAQANSSRRSMTINNGAYNVIVDHCSFSWGTDMPLLLIDGVHDTTIQWSIISEGLANSTHAEGPNFMEHSNGLSISGKNYKTTEETGNLTVHHNLIANNRGRNPQNAGYHLLDFVNNVVYNWGGQAFITTNLQAGVPSNVIGNYFKKGINTFSQFEVRGSISNNNNPPPQIYVQGNIGPNRTSDTQPETNVMNSATKAFVVPTRFDAPPVTTTTANVAFNDVLTEAGMTYPFIDAVDKRVIAEVLNGAGEIIDCTSPNELSTPIDCSTRIAPTEDDYLRWGIIDPIDDKGWPILPMGLAPVDSDHDGMPDNWETANGTNPIEDDSADDLDGDGYTNIEEYINELVAS